MWMNSRRFHVRPTSSSTTYSRIRGNKRFRLDEKKNMTKTKKSKKEEESKQ